MLAVALMALASCTDKTKQGTIVYELDYLLPDSLRSYAAFLPNKATVYFKGDSVVNIQQHSADESTTVITHKPTNFMLVLLKSATKRYQVSYNKSEQAQEFPDSTLYTFTKGLATKKIAGYNAQQYLMKNKITGESSEVWFTHDITVPPNSLTMFFNTSLGVPLAFSANQNGIITKTKVKAINFEPVPAGVFTAPAGYQKLSAQQLKEMPVEE